MLETLSYGIGFACKNYGIAMLKVIPEVVWFCVGGVCEGDGEVGLDAKVD